MKTFILAYMGAFVSMLVIDGIWLSTMARKFYSQHIGHLMAEKPNLVPAIIFYLIYILGITALVVLPAVQNQQSNFKTFLMGALLGLVAYGTYDLTNQATLKNWPTIVTGVDLVWGAVLTGVVATIAKMVTTLWK